MPGLVVFRRRWSVGSDDLVVPGAFLLTIHFICFVIVLVSLILFDFNTTVLSVKLLLYHEIGYAVILFFSICIEIGLCIISMRGSILDSDRRTTINVWIYLKSMVIFFDITWLVLGSIWLANYYFDAPIDAAKKVFVAIIIANWALVFMTIVTIWCTFDSAGRSWVKMKKYQRSMRETESRFNYKRSNSMNRNWRQRKVIRAYQDSWDHRCRLLFCCMGSSERNRNSFTDIARLLSDFFRELDVVPSDVVAGLVLLRKFQKLEREAVVRQRKNGTYEFLSGVPITERTKFLALNDAKNYDFFQTVIHYMYFAQGAYGWPMYLLINRSKLWHLVPELKCFGCCCLGPVNDTEIIKDNCCYCNYAALKKTLQVGDIEITYVTYHVDIGETPFFVAIDYTQKKVVVSIRGTLSMKDILTDLNAEGEVLPLQPPRDDWLGHKGMTQAALYIRNKLKEENLIEKALNYNLERNTHTFDLVLVGHSLGAGTAAILSILMKPDYPTLQCFSYSPPGGLLSMPAVEYSKSFITSVVLGKDVVPRIGLHQMEALRADLINAIQRSVDPKWKTISCSVICCGCGPEPTSVVEMSGKDTHINQYQEERDSARSTSAHPTDNSIALTLHQPLYPPGRIIHIVRHHPKPDENVLKTREPVYQAIWAENFDFDEVLISPVMLQDHMPDKVLAALKKVVTTSGPRKPQRQTSNAFSTTSNDCFDIEYQMQLQMQQEQYEPNDKPMHYEHYNSNEMLHHHQNFHEPHTIQCNSNSQTNLSNSVILTPSVQHKLCLETSFTNLQSPLELLNSSSIQHGGVGGNCCDTTSHASSLAGSIFGRSQLSSTQYDISSVIDSITTVTRNSPSLVPSETTTVIVNEQQHFDMLANDAGTSVPRLKAVAFDMDQPLRTNGRQHSISPQMPARSLFGRQLSATYSDKPKRKLSLNALRRASDAAAFGISDDIYALAPLASPETLSEISSISSRTSAPISLANSIERYLQQVCINDAAATQNISTLEDIYESQLHTPKIMRRAPKFTENLATCADDTRNLDQYKRMGRVFVTFPRVFPLDHKDESNTLDSSDDSFESAHSLNKHNTEGAGGGITKKMELQTQTSKSADQLDCAEEKLQSSSGSATLLTAPIDTQHSGKKLTFSDSHILDDICQSSLCPNCPCRQKLECCRRLSHDQCTLLSTTTIGNANTGSVDTTYYSANSSIAEFSTPAKLNGHAVAERPGLLESHFPVFETPPAAATADKKLANNNNNNNNINHNSPCIGQPIMGGRIRKRLSSEEFIFTRADDMPLLVQLAERSAGGSPMQRKHKGCIYPAGNNLLVTHTPTTTKYLRESPSKCAAQATTSAASQHMSTTHATAAAGPSNESNV